MEVLFKAELRNIKLVYNFLKSISFRENALVRVSAEGLKLTVQEMKSVQTSAYIPQEFFYSFNLHEIEELNLQISMKVLTEFLNIFDDGNPFLKIVYQEIGEPLILMMEHDEDPITADCKLYTMEGEEPIDLYLSSDDRVNSILLKAPIFVDIIRDLDLSSERLELYLDTEEPFFRLSTFGQLGEIHVDISPNSEMVEKFQCRERTKLSYTLRHIKQLEKVMSHSSRVSINTGAEAGLLYIQMIIELNQGNSTNTSAVPAPTMYAEFFCTALIDKL